MAEVKAKKAQNINAVNKRTVLLNDIEWAALRVKADMYDKASEAIESRTYLSFCAEIASLLETQEVTAKRLGKSQSRIAQWAGNGQPLIQKMYSEIPDKDLPKSQGAIDSLSRTAKSVGPEVAKSVASKNLSRDQAVHIHKEAKKEFQTVTDKSKATPKTPPPPPPKEKVEEFRERVKREYEARKPMYNEMWEEQQIRLGMRPPDRKSVRIETRNDALKFMGLYPPTHEVIKLVYKYLASQYHPDRHSGDSELMTNLNICKRILDI